MIIWFIFALITFYLTLINYYNGTSIVDFMEQNGGSVKLGKTIRFIASIVIATIYGYMGPIGLLMLVFLKYENLMLTNDWELRFDIDKFKIDLNK